MFKLKNEIEIREYYWKWLVYKNIVYIASKLCRRCVYHLKKYYPIFFTLIRYSAI